MRLGNSGCASTAGPIAAAARATRSSSRRRRRGSRTAGCRSRRAGSSTSAPIGVAARPGRRAALMGKSCALSAGAAHVDAAAVGAGDLRADLAGDGVDRELVELGPAAAAQVEDRLARAVARQLGLGAVGVEDAQVGDVPGSSAGRAEHAVGEHAEVPRAERRTRAARQLKRELVALDDQVVVAERLPLLESHPAAESRISTATSSAERPVTSIGVTPASLRIQASWRRA